MIVCLPVSEGVYSTRHVSELSGPFFSPSSSLLQLISSKAPFPLLVNVTFPEGLFPSAAVTEAVQVASWPSTTVEGAHDTDALLGIRSEPVTVTVVVAFTVVVAVEVTVAGVGMAVTVVVSVVVLVVVVGDTDVSVVVTVIVVGGEVEVVVSVIVTV